MDITITIPDDIADDLKKAFPDGIPRRIVELIAVEAARKAALTDFQTQQLLGYESRFQVWDFYKRERIESPLTAEELIKEMEDAEPFIVHGKPKGV